MVTHCRCLSSKVCGLFNLFALDGNDQFLKVVAFCHWLVTEICNNMQLSVGYLHGGAVVRFFHCHANQCLTAPRDASWPW